MNDLFAGRSLLCSDLLCVGTYTERMEHTFNLQHNNLLIRILIAAALTVTGVAIAHSYQQSNTSELPPGSAEVVQPADLAKALRSSSSKPTVLYVGPRFLYAQAHISDAEFIGPASDPDSLDKLQKRVAGLAKNSPIVLYCGCCPWDHCPNIRPAYSALRKAGFTSVKALYLAKSFGTDWVDKGYPVEKGQ